MAGDSLRAFEYVVKQALLHKPKHIVIGGDLLDSPHPPSEVVTVLDKAMESLRSAGIPVYYVQGQHCRAVPSWLSRHANTYYLEEGPGPGIHGFDNCSAEELRQKLSKLPDGVKILVLHQMCKGAPCGNWDFDPEWLKDHPGLRLILMGDLHIPWTGTFPRKGGTFQVIYGGSLAMQAVNEPPEKSFLKIYEEEDPPKIETVYIPSRTFRMFTALSMEDLMKVEKGLMALPKGELKPLVVLNHAPDLPDVEKLRENHKDAVFMLRPLPASFDPAGTDVLVPSAVSLEGCLDLVVKREEKPELHSFLLQVLTAPEPRVIVESMIDRAVSCPAQ